MRAMRVAAVLTLSIFALVSCNRDPNVAKKRYLDNGNKYYERGKFKEASIMYRSALQKDLRYGEAHYRLGLAQLKLGQIPAAVGSFRRAVDLLPAEQAAHWDAMVKLSEVYLAATRDKQLLDEVERNCQMLLKRDPNSFDGHRLTGDLTYVRASEAYRVGKKEDGQKLLQEAVDEYRKAEAVKPGEQGISMQLARSLAAQNNYPEAERIYRTVIEKDKTFQAGYSELYRLFVFQNKAAEGEQVLKQGFLNNPKQFAFLTMLAAHYYGHKDQAQMVSVLQQIKSHAGEFDQAYVTVGDFYLRVGDGDEAIRQYREGMAKDEKKKTTYQKRIVEVLMRQGKRGEAADVNGQILKDTPNDSDARSLSASFLLDKGDVNKALSELQSVVTRSPENPVAHYQLGRAHSARGEWEQARQQFQKAIELRPDYIMARLALAQLQVTRREFDAALKTAAEVLAIDRSNVNALLIESAALMGQKKFGDSRTLLDQMVKANPNSPDVVFQLGVVNLAESKFTEAANAFQRAYQLNPANSRGLMGVVETYMAQNKPDTAIQLLQAEADKSPKRVEFRVALGNIAVRAGKYDAAIAEFQKVLPLLDKNSKLPGDIYLRIGETYRRKGDLNSSIAALQKAREVLPDSPVVLSTLALTLDGAGRKPEARQAYEATLKLEPNNAVALNNMAFLMAETGGDLDQALTMAQRAKQLLPTMFEVSDTLGWIYLKKNLSDNAIDIFKDLVAKRPNHSTYRYHLAMALSQKGDKPRALKELQEALKENPSKDERAKIQDLITKLG